MGSRLAACAQRLRGVRVTDALRVVLLGGLDVFLGDAPLCDFTSRKSLALLSYLITTGRSHSREALSALLWGESAEGRARASLRTVLWDLRQHVPDHVSADRQSVTFDTSGPHWLDVGEFSGTIEQVLDSGQARSDAGTRLSDEEVEALEGALALYRGDFLAGFYISEAPNFESWVLRKREWARQLAIQGWHQLVLHYTADQAYLNGIDAATQLLEIAPWQEETHRQLMRLLALSGQRGAALAQYETCREMLDEELGVEPTTETRLLYNRIKTGKPLEAVGAPRTEVDRIRLGPDGGGIPTRLGSLIGRDDELASLKRLLSDPESRLTWLVGPDGVGKSRLAWETAEQMVDAFEDGVWLVRPEDAERAAAGDGAEMAEGGLSPSGHVILPLIRAFGLFPTGATSLPTQLADHLCHKEMLLIFDGGTVGDGDVEWFSRLLACASLMRLLVVSVRPPHGAPGKRLRLGGLDVPETDEEQGLMGVDLEGQRPEGGLALFLERAQDTDPDLEIDAYGGRHAARLTELSQGSPLALELLGASVGRAALDELARRYARRVDEASAGASSKDRLRTATRAAMLSVWDLLGQSRQVSLAKLALFDRDFSETAALEVAGVALAQLRGLIRLGWVDRVGGGRCVLHRSIRDFVRAKLKELAWGSGGGPVSIDGVGFGSRFRSHYLGMVARRATVLTGRAAATASDDIERDWRNVRTAWRDACVHGDCEHLSDALEGLTRFFLLRGWLREGELLLGSAYESVMEQAGDCRAEMVAARLLAEQSRLLNARGACHAGAVAARAAVDRVSDDDGLDPWRHAVRGTGLVELGHALYRQGELAAATDRLKEALSLVGDGPSAEVKARAFQHLGAIGVISEAYSEAETYLGKALDVYGAIDHAFGRSQVRHALGLAALHARRYRDAEQHLEKSIGLAEKIGYRRGEALALNGLGRLAGAEGDYDRGTVHCQKALRIARDICDRLIEAETLVELAVLLLHQGRTDEAWKRGVLAVEIARDLGEPVLAARAWLVSGHVFTELGMLDQAREACQSALELQRRLGQSNLALESLACMARIRLAGGDTSGAKDLVERVFGQLGTCSLTGANEPMRVYLTCYEVLTAVEDPRARDVLRTVLDLYEEGESVAVAGWDGGSLPGGDGGDGHGGA